MPVPIVLSYAYGTIGLVRDHRIRLTDQDVALILAALRARRAMARELREHHIDRLIARLAEMAPGNPKLVHGEYEQTHEDELEEDGD